MATIPIAERMIAAHIKGIVRDVEGRAAVLAAEQTTQAAIDAIGIG